MKILEEMKLSGNSFKEFQRKLFYSSGLNIRRTFLAHPLDIENFINM